MSALELLEQKREEIERLCRRYYVVRLRVFGSALTPSWSEGSDIDLAVEYSPSRHSLDPLDATVGLKLGLEDLLEVEVDAVDWNAVRNPKFRESVDQTAQLFYAA